jgi:hypothetical protein
MRMSLLQYRFLYCTTPYVGRPERRELELADFVMRSERSEEVGACWSDGGRNEAVVHRTMQGSTVELTVTFLNPYQYVGPTGMTQDLTVRTERLHSKNCRLLRCLNAPEIVANNTTNCKKLGGSGRYAT